MLTQPLLPLLFCFPFRTPSYTRALGHESLVPFSLSLITPLPLLLPHQDPFLYKGTVRRNLDPLADHNDEELWNILDQVCGRKKVWAKVWAGLQAICAGSVRR